MTQPQQCHAHLLALCEACCLVCEVYSITLHLVVVVLRG